VKSYGLTLLRVTVGALYILHAYRLLTVVTPAGTATFVSRAFGLPYPGILGWAVIVAFGLGGLMLVAGILTRGVAAVDALIAGAVLARVHVPPHGLLRGSTLIQAGPASGFEYGVLLTVATVTVLMLGSGPLALRPSK
jgi:putative oxidoreductase